MAHDVFISYSTHDKAVADRICHALEERQVRCWIAPRDVPYGADWPRSIMDALATAKAVVLVFTSNTNASQAVRKEVLAAVENGVIVIPFRTEDVLPEGALRFNLIDVHWLDAFSPPLDNHIDHLIETIRRLTSQDIPRPGPLDGHKTGADPDRDIPPDFDAAERERREQLEQARRDKLGRRRPPGPKPDEGGINGGAVGGSTQGSTEPPKPQVASPESWIATPLHRQFYAWVALAALLALLVVLTPWLLLAVPFGIAALWRRSYVPKAGLAEAAPRAWRIVASVAVALLAIGIAVGRQALRPHVSHDYHITIANQTGQTISNFYASHENGPVSTQDRLGATTLASGSELALDLNDGSGECNWSFRAVVPSGPNITQDDVNVCATSTLTLQPNGSGATSSTAADSNTTSASSDLTGGNSLGAARYAVTITNTSGKVIRNLYTSSDGSNWSSDLLGTHTLMPGASIRVNFDDGSGECIRSLKAVFSDNTDTEHYAIDICTTATYAFTG